MLKLLADLLGLFGNMIDLAVGAPFIQPPGPTQPPEAPGENWDVFALEYRGGDALLTFEDERQFLKRGVSWYSVPGLTLIGYGSRLHFKLNNALETEITRRKHGDLK